MTIWLLNILYRLAYNVGLLSAHIDISLRKLSFSSARDNNRCDLSMSWKSNLYVLFSVVMGYCKWRRVIWLIPAYLLQLLIMLYSVSRVVLLQTALAAGGGFVSALLLCYHKIPAREVFLFCNVPRVLCKSRAILALHANLYTWTYAPNGRHVQHWKFVP